MVEQMTKAVLSAASRSEANSGWRRSPARRGKELELVNAILEESQMPSKASVFAEAEEADSADSLDVSSTSLLPKQLPLGVGPGSFVQMRRNWVVISCIFLSEDYSGGEHKVLLLTITGKLIYGVSEDIMYAIPNFVDSNLVARIGKDPVATASPQLMARVVALRKLREFHKLGEDGYNSLARPFSRLFDQVCSPDPNQWAEITVPEVVKLIGPDRLSPELASFCLHEHLMTRSQEYVADSTDYFNTQKFLVRPRSHVERIKTVNDMLAKDDPRISRFVEKAKMIINDSRRRADESNGEMPSFSSSQTHEFIDDDRIFLWFLRDSLHQLRSIQLDPYTASVCALVKAMDAYSGDISTDTVRQMLIELGVFAPWQDLVSLRVEFQLEDEHEDSPRARERAALVQRGLSVPPSSGPLGPEDFYPSDRLESIRHDFGDMPVYVIDDYHAEELDDGMSVEIIPTEPDYFWLHVHIADPTSLLHPNHILSQRARKGGESQYFNHVTWPMLPPSLMKHGLSLGVNSALNKPDRVLTFSAKIDPTGEIVDHKVRAGLIRNVHVLHYEDVDHSMTFEVKRPTYPFGRLPDFRQPSSLGLAPSDRENLRLLDTLAKRLSAQRLALNTVIFDSKRASVSLSPRPLPFGPNDAQRPTAYRGFPELSYQVGGADIIETGSRRIVAESMKAAGRVASRFGLERGIPLVRRGLERPSTSSESEFQELLSMRNQQGIVDYWHALRLHVSVPPATNSLQPKRHWTLGISSDEGYSWVTSPLRRYWDLAAHWQIKEALLSPGSKPMFSAVEMQALIDDNASGERVRKRLRELHTVFWSALYVKRWMANNKTTINDTSSPLKGLVAYVLGTAKYDPRLGLRWQKGIVPKLGIPVCITLTNGEAAEVGDTVGVNISQIVLSDRPRVYTALA